MRYFMMVLALFGLLGATPEIASKNITISDPWVHATSGSSALLHVIIANTDSRTDHLVRASAPIATKVAIWNQLGKQGDGFMIPGRAEFVLGGDPPRIELFGITHALQPNTHFQLLLVFQRAGKITVDVRVERVMQENVGDRR